MAVQKEIKSQLAKLLATEDIVVEHKQCETAQFDVHTRVLTLPLWEKASNNVYDMLVGHEVGHALFTPDEDWTKDAKVPPQFINVVEDARIEKMMKRRYLGIAKSFYRGYSELHDKDFFELNDTDIDDLNLADRANLHFKIGSFLNISFSIPEKKIIDMIAECETFTQVKEASKVLYQYCKDQLKEEEVPNLKEEANPTGGLTEDEDNEKQELDLPEGGSSSTEEIEDDTEVSSTIKDADIDADEPKVETAEALDSALQDLVNHNGIENLYLELPDLDVDAIVVDPEEIHTEIDYHWNQEQKIMDDRVKQYSNGLFPSNIFEKVDEEYYQFKNNAKREVSYLVKEFECKKSADSYARATVARTGVLDTTKLQTYKFNEDLFKKVSIVPDGKNHGLIFILDWSGSMAHVMQDTIKQLYNLIWFCKKVSIPFEVYAFTNEWNRCKIDYETGRFIPQNRPVYYEAKEYNLMVDENFSLMNIISSKVNAKKLEHHMKNIFRVVSSFGYYNSYHDARYYTAPHKMSLSGTPLNEALICLHKILPQFQIQNKLQKVQCIILTDGEASQVPYHIMVNRGYYRGEDDPYMGTRNIGSNSFLRDRKVGKTYGFGYYYHTFTGTLINNLKDNFPSTNFIGIRVLENRDAGQFIRTYTNYDSVKTEKLQSQWRKTKSFNIQDSCYDAYFGMSASALANDSEFDVDDSATKAQIKRAFVKSLKTKKLNKKVLGEFIDLVV